jgi:hypothetical protein
MAAWYEDRVESGQDSAGMSYVAYRVQGAVIRNASGLPVYDVRVSFSVDVRERSGLTWRQVSVTRRLISCISCRRVSIASSSRMTCARPKGLTGMILGSWSRSSSRMRMSAVAA